MILLATLRVGEGAYGVPIAREIEATDGAAPMLTLLVGAGLGRLIADGGATAVATGSRFWAELKLRPTARRPSGRG